MDESTLTTRGQISVPASLRKAMHLRPGQRLKFAPVSEHEFRVIAMNAAPLGPLAMLGHARKLRAGPARRTSDWMRELREGEQGAQMWIVDTCMVLDVFEDDSRFGRSSAMLLDELLPDGLAVSPVTMVELSPAFGGDIAEQKRFLDQAGISHSETWGIADMEAAHSAWHRYVAARRAKVVPKRPIADILIGGFALNRQGLVTRNPSDFRRWFPRLTIREP